MDDRSRQHFIDVASHLAAAISTAILDIVDRVNAGNEEATTKPQPTMRVHRDGTKEWCRPSGELHREDGPARETAKRVSPPADK